MYMHVSIQQQVFSRVGGVDVSLRVVTIAQIGKGARECGWRHAPEARGVFGRFWKSQSSVLPRNKTIGFRLLAEARPVAWWRVLHVLWGGQMEKLSYKCARGVVVIVGGNGHGDTSLNPGPDGLHFT